MSIEAIEWALNLPHGNPTHKAVLFGLANHADPDGACHPSIPRLVMYTALHRASVIRAIGEMEAIGLIGGEHVLGRRTRYTLNFDWKPVAERDQSQSATGRTARLHRSHSATTTGRTARPEPSLTVNDRQKREISRATSLPVDWVLPEEWRAWALDQGLSPARIAQEADAMADWAAHKGETSKDWRARWRNWIRNALKRDQQRPQSRASSGRSRLMDAALGQITPEIPGLDGDDR